jgi:CO/xanthine dehydrogenase Mo-binding subunit
MPKWLAGSKRQNEAIAEFHYWRTTGKTLRSWEEFSMGVEGIGASVARKEDKRFLTGKGRYTDDMSVPGMKYAFFVRSPYAHARIKSIDISRHGHAGRHRRARRQAAAADGIGNIICGWMIHSKDGSPMKMGVWRPLAVETVRYVGDAVAIVVADSWARRAMRPRPSWSSMTSCQRSPKP